MSDIVNEAKKLVESISEDNRAKVTTNQMRKFYASVNSIYNKVKSKSSSDDLSPDIAEEISLLEIKLVYQVSRDAKNQYMKKLYEQLAPKIRAIKKSRTEFLKFAKFMEAVIAWHKYYGGDK